MHEMTCLEVNESVPEFTLGILTPDEHDSVAAHLRACPACRLEVESMQSVSEQLLDLIPGTEPPLGFDRRVLIPGRFAAQAGEEALPHGRHPGGGRRHRHRRHHRRRGRPHARIPLPC